MIFVYVNLYICCSFKEINRIIVDGLMYFGRKNINRIKLVSIEINILERRKNIIYFNIIE